MIYFITLFIIIIFYFIIILFLIIIKLIIKLLLLKLITLFFLPMRRAFLVEACKLPDNLMAFSFRFIILPKSLHEFTPVSFQFLHKSVLSYTRHCLQCSITSLSSIPIFQKSHSCPYLSFPLLVSCIRITIQLHNIN